MKIVVLGRYCMPLVGNQESQQRELLFDYLGILILYDNCRYLVFLGISILYLVLKKEF